MSGKLWKILNNYPSLNDLKKGKLILVKTRILKSVYVLDIDDQLEYQVGLLLSSGADPDSLQDVFNNMYAKKMYKVLICGSILVMFREDISEVLETWEERKKIR